MADHVNMYVHNGCLNGYPTNRYGWIPPAGLINYKFEINFYLNFMFFNKVPLKKDQIWIA
jgi:hypothetical protein